MLTIIEEGNVHDSDTCSFCQSMSSPELLERCHRSAAALMGEALVAVWIPVATPIHWIEIRHWMAAHGVEVATFPPGTQPWDAARVLVRRAERVGTRAVGMVMVADGVGSDAIAQADEYARRGLRAFHGWAEQ